MHPYQTALLIFAIGLVVGSFLNVCIYRLPRGESVVWPGSHCPHCGAPIKPYDNIPVLSYLLLRGRCRSCKAPISWRYPAVELITGMLFLSLYLEFGLSLTFFRYLFLGCALIVGTFIDLEHQLLLDVITLPTLAIGVATAFLEGVVPGLHALLGAAAGGGTIYAIAVFGRTVFGQDSIGGGDLKLAAAIGAYMGWSAVLGMILLSFFLAAPVAALGIVSGRMRVASRVPFGPFITVATLLVLFWGPQLWHAYVRLVTA